MHTNFDIYIFIPTGHQYASNKIELAWILLRSGGLFIFKKLDFCVAPDLMLSVPNAASVLVRVRSASLFAWVTHLHLVSRFDFYSTSSLKQQSAGRSVVPLGYIILIPRSVVPLGYIILIPRSVVPLGYIILIPSQPAFVLTLYWCVFIGEATNTNFIVFGLTDRGSNTNLSHSWRRGLE